MQKKLNTEQIAAFYHDIFVEQQLRHFKKIISKDFNKVVVDVGGGCGFFARALKDELNLSVRVIDSDPISVSRALDLGVDAICEDALSVKHYGDEGVICFNLILHHLVSDSEEKTRLLQVNALKAWKGAGVKIFVNEYIYESWGWNLSGKLIYQITKNNLLSSLGKMVSNFAPTLHANTFGIGVRFRGSKEWRDIFKAEGFKILTEIEGEDEGISWARRLLFIKTIKRNSFLLEID